MTNPRYMPRNYCLEPALFGKRFDLTWREFDGRDKALLAAAQLQNEYAVFIRHQVQTQKNTLKVYAKAAGISYDRLMKMLRGDVVMRLEDIGMAHLLLHLDIGLHQPGTQTPAVLKPRTTT